VFPWGSTKRVDGELKKRIRRTKNSQHILDLVPLGPQEGVNPHISRPLGT